MKTGIAMFAAAVTIQLAYWAGVIVREHTLAADGMLIVSGIAAGAVYVRSSWFERAL